MELPEVSVTTDGHHIMIGEYRLTLEEGRSIANEALGKIEFTLIWGNRNDRSKSYEP